MAKRMNKGQKQGSIKNSILMRIFCIILAVAVNGVVVFVGLGGIRTSGDALEAAIALDTAVTNTQKWHYELSDALNSTVNMSAEPPTNSGLENCPLTEWQNSPEAAGITDEAILALITEAQVEHEEIHSIAADICTRAANDDKASARMLFLTSFHPKLVELAGKLDAVGELSTEILTASQKQQDDSYMTMVVGISISLVLVVISIYLVVGYMIHRIAKPLQVITSASEKLAEGDLSFTIDMKSRNDEIGRLADSLNASVVSLNGYITELDRVLGMVAAGELDAEELSGFHGDFVSLGTSVNNIVDGLNTILSSIHETSGLVTEGATQVSSGSQALAQGATEQASAVQELAASITQISEQVQSNAKNADAANGKVNDVSNEILASNEKMIKMTAAMKEIHASSNEIGKIIKTIDDIAFQTNILALNAAVEAARAGEAGKGFAVVADEVRNLASKSADAAKETTALIDKSIAAVQNGSHIVDDTAKSLVAVVDSAREAAENVALISQASEDQAVAIEQVTRGVDQISSVVQTNSATAEESAATSEELTGQAKMLEELVGRFKLRGKKTE